jgi:hypothetical protein
VIRVRIPAGAFLASEKIQYALIGIKLIYSLMEKLEFYGSILTLLVIVFAVGIFIGRGGQNQSASTSTLQSSTTVPQGNGSGPLFSSEPYYGYSYLIAPGSLSPQATAALDGYAMAVKNSTSGENVTISYSGRSASANLQSGEKLYIVETSFGDDAPGYEGSPADDGFVVIDASGYVLRTFVV